MADWVTTGKVASGQEFHDYAANTLAAGNYEWQVRTWDAADAEGAWSALGTFVVPDPVATVKVRRNGAWVEAPVLVRHGGAWVAVPADRLKVRRNGAWVSP